MLFSVLIACDHDYRIVGTHSPGPGILRITLQADPTDDRMIIAGDTVLVAGGDSMAVHIGQGRVYRGQSYAVIYKGLSEYQERTSTINVLEMMPTGFEETTIFETFLPPGSYDSLAVAMTATYLNLGLYQIPIEQTPGASPLFSLRTGFGIRENGLTVLRVRCKPLQSLRRVKDSFHYTWIAEVWTVEHF